MAPTQSCLQWVPGLSPGVKQPELLINDYTSPSEIKHEWNYALLPLLPAVDVLSDDLCHEIIIL